MNKATKITQIDNISDINETLSTLMIKRKRPKFFNNYLCCLPKFLKGHHDKIENRNIVGPDPLIRIGDRLIRKQPSPSLSLSRQPQ